MYIQLEVSEYVGIKENVAELFWKKPSIYMILSMHTYLYLNLDISRFIGGIFKIANCIYSNTAISINSWVGFGVSIT